MNTLGEYLFANFGLMTLLILAYSYFVRKLFSSYIDQQVGEALEDKRGRIDVTVERASTFETEVLKAIIELWEKLQEFRSATMTHLTMSPDSSQLTNSRNAVLEIEKDLIELSRAKAVYLPQTIEQSISTARAELIGCFQEYDSSLSASPQRRGDLSVLQREKMQQIQSGTFESETNKIQEMTRRLARAGGLSEEFFEVFFESGVLENEG